MSGSSTRLVAAALPLLLGTPDSTQTAQQEPGCFDASVIATIVSQTPTPWNASCGDDCIVMSGPWIVHLNVQKVLEGRVRPGKITVMTIQHSAYIPNKRFMWHLRRTTVGVFNAAFADSRPSGRRCAAGAADVRPFVHLSDGKTVETMERELQRAQAAQ